MQGEFPLVLQVILPLDQIYLSEARELPARIDVPLDGTDPRERLVEILRRADIRPQAKANIWAFAQYKVVHDLGGKIEGEHRKLNVASSWE